MIDGPITAHETLYLTSCYFEQLGTSLGLTMTEDRFSSNQADIGQVRALTRL